MSWDKIKNKVVDRKKKCNYYIIVIFKWQKIIFKWKKFLSRDGLEDAIEREHLMKCSF